MKKKSAFLAAFLCAALLAGACACTNKPSDGNEPGGPVGGPVVPDIDEEKLVKVLPAIYDNKAVLTIDEVIEKEKDAPESLRKIKSLDSWINQVSTVYNDPSEYSVIKSPYHTLKINDTEVPVYTARCGEGPHSFAWVDINSEDEEFQLKVELSLGVDFAQCVVLPQSRNVGVKITGRDTLSVIEDYGSFTYTFTNDPEAVATDPTLAPLTIMVTKEEKLKVPAGYDVEPIEPGYHADRELEFTRRETVYVFKEGLHEISSINIPSDSIVYLERGAYLKCADRITNGAYNTMTAIHTENTENAKLLGRGLLDMGSCLGGDDKHKHVLNASRANDVVFSGITVVNSDTWTMCFYNCDRPLAEYNLLLGYRTYSDGIMMSECRNGLGRYNFVRTGDDAIEYKATGWGGTAVGSDCVYEYNDVWTDKGCAYGVIWESECDMDNMIFRNNAVGFAQPTWSAGNNALDCRLGTKADAKWSNIVFKDFEIYHVISYNVCKVSATDIGAILENVTFENIKVHSSEMFVYAMRMELGSSGNIKNVMIKNYDFCGKTITQEDVNDSKVFNIVGGKKKYLKEQVTVG